MAKFLFGKLIPAAFILAGLIFIGVGVAQFSAASDTSSWPAVSGKVLVKNIQSQRNRGANGKTETGYLPKVTYSYVVAGKTYEGSRLTMGIQTFRRSSDAQKAIKDYEEGKECTVYYDPADPQSSVLEKGVQPFHALFPILGLGVAGIGIAIAFLVPYAIRKEAAKRQRLAAYERERLEREKERE